MEFPKRVLLVDDDEDDCYIFNTVIDSMGSGIEFYYDRDSERALKSLFDEQRAVPDLLFLDWNMPKLSGREFLEAIRKFPLFATVPIVIYTTSTARHDREEAGRLGASYFTTKPSTIQELQDLLQHVFSMKWK